MKHWDAARFAEVELGPGVTAALLRDTETPDALPLLSFTLWKLHKDYADDNLIDLDEYERQLGGIRGAISKEADEVAHVAKNTGKWKDLGKAFLKMARLNEDKSSYARQTASLDDPEIKHVEPILRQFEKRRLVVFRKEGESEFVEVAHEAPEELFYYLIDEEGYTLDDAILRIAEVNEISVAVDLAVYLCAPEADPGCVGSEVLETWEAFLVSIEETSSVTETVSDLIDREFDEWLLAGIAVYWCSPEPGAGCSADEDVYSLTWAAFDEALTNSGGPAEAIDAIIDVYDPIIVELIAVFLCGHPTCYDGEDVSWGDQQTAVSQEPLRPSGLKRHTTKRRRSSRPTRSTRSKR